MYLTITKPQNRFGLLSTEMDRMLSEIFNGFNGNTMLDADSNWAPRVDVHETPENFIVHLDVPGVDKNDIKVKFEDNTLTVTGERKYESRNEEKDFRHVERTYGTFTRSLRLAKDVDAQKIQAAYKNGVLEITLPKAEEVKPKEIEVKIG